VPMGNTPESSKRTAATLQDFVYERYLPFAQNRKRGWEMERRHLEHHILPRFGAVPLSEISEKKLMDWVKHLEQKGLAHSSCFRLFWLFKSVLNYAVLWGDLESDAGFRSARLSSRPGRVPELLSVEERHRLLTILSSFPHRAAAEALHLMLLTGAGKSEILCARWEDVDLDRGVLVTEKTFTGRARFVPLSGTAIEFIRRLPRKEGVPWLFFSRNGTRLVSVARQWGAIREQLGRPQLRLQDLRHNFANMLLEEGMAPQDLKLILGHYKREALDAVRKNSLPAPKKESAFSEQS